jgi:hypothetical protein
MNLYAIIPCYAPGPEVELMLAETDEEALKHGVFAAAYDMLRPNYGSPTALVYRIGAAEQIGEAKAVDAPAEWEWARGIHARVAEEDQFMASLDAERPKP